MTQIAILHLLVHKNKKKKKRLFRNTACELQWRRKDRNGALFTCCSWATTHWFRLGERHWGLAIDCHAVVSLVIGHVFCSIIRIPSASSNIAFQLAAEEWAPVYQQTQLEQSICDGPTRLRSSFCFSFQPSHKTRLGTETLLTYLWGDIICG